MDFSIIAARSVQLFFLLGPLSSAPMVVSITTKMSKRAGAMLVIRECLFAGLLCFLFNHGGAPTLANVGISIHALRLAGGILLSLSGLEFLGLRKGNLSSERADPEKMFLVPVGCPMLAGPGTLFSIAALPANEVLITDVSCVIVICSAILLLLAFQWNAKMFHATFLLLLERLSGLFIMGLGCEMILKGLWHFSDMA
ncbi:MarC family protein [Candidatus Similichlamydia laticola]|uniref:UPF0056 membrane protein n=1 Tax=Candidatus Similichlamydia laticola TaxID=2170265 RepID=A0A369KBY9_9BACT|nr:MarC family protein [Candidatus Similichlamydia laticola]RDB31428.1 hypothetical protein HAT2_00467 [Candidatus Similichlamydia laticola]